ncbi:F-box protein SKIP23-like [Lotus japonicus]|uniref:F-box protein SKIP23-like n=1 Tax=Lotus japonicus TaxID=34305 RepID=UPI00258C8A66|nr:F-box protein SKIP23-like [Lotus japonicus]
MQQPKADWSQLPKELLHQISERLDSPLYLLRFRSVCSWWRSSSTPLFPLHKASSYFLSKCTIFLIMPPPHHPIQTPILVQIGQDRRGRLLLSNPLSCSPSFPIYCSRVLDLYNLPVIDLGNVFVLHRSPPAHRPCHRYSIVMTKVAAAITVSCQGKQEVSILLMVHQSQNKLTYFRFSEGCWTITPEEFPPYDDVCVFNGRPCAVHFAGRTVAVGSGPDLDLVAKPVLGKNRKFLVESEGSLLLVHKRRIFTYQVFRLDEKERSWVEVKSLGDRVLFLGDLCTFSASASDLRVDRGNCVVFEDSNMKGGVGVFPLDVGQASPLSDHPDYSRLFDYNRLF